MALATTDFDEQRLFATLDEVDDITREPFRAMKAELDDAPRDPLRRRRRTSCGPWHYDDPVLPGRPQAAGVDLDPYLADASLDVDHHERLSPSNG